MECEARLHVFVYIKTVYFCALFSGTVHSMTWIKYPNRKAGVKISFYVEFYEYVKVYYGDKQAFIIGLVIISRMNVI